MKFGLRVWRTIAGASAKEMATFVGVSTNSIYDWEKGISSPRVNQGNKIVDFLATKGVDICLNDIIF